MWRKTNDIVMKKILLTLALCFGICTAANAQSDAAIIGKFLDAIVQKDVVTLMEVSHSYTHKDIDKLIAQSEMLQFQNWNYVHAYNLDGENRYIVAFSIGLDPYSISEDILSYESRKSIITPSGHILAYEMLGIQMENGKKRVRCNADILSITDVERILRKSGKYLPSKYYEGDY